jgi:hypothetical protein
MAIAALALTVVVILAAILAGVLSGRFLTGVVVLFICGIAMIILGVPLWVISAAKTARRKTSD